MLMFPLVAAKASGAPDTSTTAAAIRIFFISVASKYKTSSKCFCRLAVRVGVGVEARRHYRTFTSFVTDECRRPRILQRNVSDAGVASRALSIVSPPQRTSMLVPTMPRHDERARPDA